MNVKDITLEMLWDWNLMRFEKPIREILVQARGELVLEGMLKEVKARWNAFNLELFRYSNRPKVRLIKGWNELIDMLDEDLNNFDSMTQSPYYTAFEEEIIPWLDKLEKIKMLMEVWLEVQKNWMYLENIFSGSSEIRQRLTLESNHFDKIDKQFTKIMYQVA
jgi:dynein heavy chain 1, cytosolic